jgi:ribonuclease HI
VWALAPEEISDYVENLQEPHAWAWLASVLKDLSTHESNRVIVTLWALWYAQRKIIHEGEYQSPLSTHLFVGRFLNDLEVLEPKPAVAGARPVGGPKWIQPPVGLAKINVDAALSKNTSKGALAAVARSVDGTFLGASVVVVEGFTDPEVLEVMACREGLSLAADLLLARFSVASDCLNVIKSLEGEGWGVYGHIVKEVKARASDFQTVQFVHEGRSSNGNAHWLARGSILRDIGRHVWFQTPPEGVCTNFILIQ